VEYNDNEQESSTVVTSQAIREDVDSIFSFNFYDANANNIGDHIAIPLTQSGNLDFTDWVPSGFVTTVDNVNNNEVTFADPVPDDVIVVIGYQTQDSTRYADIYLGDDTADTFPLKVTQVIITDSFTDYLVFAEYYSIAGGEVALDFSPLTEPEPIDSGAFPLQDVDVAIVYNTRSGNHFEDEFQNMNIDQTGTTFDLTRVAVGQDEQFLFELEIGYLPSPEVDINVKYEFEETEDPAETTTEQEIESTVKTAFFSRFLTTTELSYLTETSDFSNDPDVVGGTPGLIDNQTSEEWDFSNEIEYTHPLSWTTLAFTYEFEYNLREEEFSSDNDIRTHTFDLDFLLARTDLTNIFEYEIENTDNVAPTEDTWAKEFSYEFSAENKQRFKGAELTTTLEYEYELDQEKDDDDFTKSTYLFEEEIAFRKITFETSLEYQDEERGDEWTKELESDSEVTYEPFGWLELTAGLDWINTETEEDDSTETDFFLEADFERRVGRSGTFELGAKQEWLREDPGENESTFEVDAKFTYEIAKFTATFEAEYERSEFDADSDDTEDYSFKVTLERQF
jgi:hypothetical protein